MKHIITTLCIMYSAMYSAQTIELEPLILGHHHYEVRLKGNAKQFKLIIITEDKNQNRAAFIINSKYIADWHAYVFNIYKKHQEWQQVAIDNNVENYAKPYNQKPPRHTINFNIGSHTYYGTPMYAMASFHANNNHTMSLISSGPVAHQHNIYITTPGIHIYLTSDEDFTTLLNLLSWHQLSQKLQQADYSDLFQD